MVYHSIKYWNPNIVILNLRWRLALFGYDQFDFDFVVANGGDWAPMAKQKAEEIYPKHTPAVSSAGNNSDDGILAPSVIATEEDACP